MKIIIILGYWKKITLRDNWVKKGMFDDSPMLCIREMPEVEVHIVSSMEAPGGIGEPMYRPLPQP